MRFIRVIDRLFDLLNSRSPYGKGYKSPMRRENSALWRDVIDDSIKYLIDLKDVNRVPILQTRRNRFVSGLVIAAKSAKELANDLLHRKENPLDYVLDYKWSQDHIELLFNGIRGRGGKNNNPDVQQFKSALKKLLLHASVTASKYSNCMAFDSDLLSPIFSLKWTESRSAIESEETTPVDDNPMEIDHFDGLDGIDTSSISENKESILAYIAGSIVRRLIKRLECSECFESLLSDDFTNKNLSLIGLKDNGGLIYPSDDVITVVMVCEKHFHRRVLGITGKGINTSKHLSALLSRDIIRELSSTRPGKILFSSLLHHDIQTHCVNEDFHSTQIMKTIIKYYLDMRLLRYSQHYTQNVVLAGKLGKRQQLGRLVVLNGL